MNITSQVRKLTNYSNTLSVLYVEDNDSAREQTIKVLENFFTHITVAVDGDDGFEKFLDNNSFDLIITDINMPRKDGIQMVKEIRNLDKDIPIIILSAHDDSNYFINTIRLGVDGYILKPLDFAQLLSTLDKCIEKIKLRADNLHYTKQLEQLNHLLESQVDERIKEVITLNQEIKETQKEVVFTLGAVGEHRSQETGNHVKRVAEYSKLLALHYGLAKEDVELIKTASPLHDLGKIAIPDSILNKPGKLSEQEYTIMKHHAELGHSMLKSSSRPLLKAAATIAYEHHEKWNGSGYPRGIAGENIHIYGRITAIADVFDALGSDRCYKKAWEDEKIFDFFKSERGKHFDPLLIDQFFEFLDDFLQIRDELKDT